MHRINRFSRFLALALIAAALLSLAACKGRDVSQEEVPSDLPGILPNMFTNQGASPGSPAVNPGLTPNSPSANTDSTGSGLPMVLDQMEYVLYQNIFYNKQASEYTGKTAVKTGVLVRLQDRWSLVTRYYVWGYMDATKCCDWQWEFVPKDPASLPPDGSLVEMTGKLVYDEKALDKYWFQDATVTLKKSFTGQHNCDVDLSLMDSTLERVQLSNLMKDPALFNGKTVLLYGRVKSLDSIQHPYYDNAWSLSFSSEAQIPAIGTMVLISGTWENDHLVNATLTPTSDY